MSLVCCSCLCLKCVWMMVGIIIVGGIYYLSYNNFDEAVIVKTFTSEYELLQQFFIKYREIQPTILTVKKELSSDEAQFVKNNAIEETTKIILESIFNSFNFTL